ncbi:MAG: hypothetical protein PUF50_03825 [Erysipelotrichaceae bacterium]|nr:hypothetical protein [Erysipelotrichaceae bacterium]
MKKKLLALGIVVAIALVGIVLLNPKHPESQEGSKQIHIVIENRDANKILLEQTFQTDALTLESFLLEHQEELQVVFSEDRTYGAFIISMMNQSQGSTNQGPWWMFESSNNETCQLEGFCPSSDQIPLQDQDQFIFYLTSSF